MPFSHHVGELRAHYAGFFDPGFGYGREGELKGAVGVLEVRPHETITIYDGQVTHDMLLDYLRRDHFFDLRFDFHLTLRSGRSCFSWASLLFFPPPYLLASRLCGAADLFDGVLQQFVSAS